MHALRQTYVVIRCGYAPPSGQPQDFAYADMSVVVLAPITRIIIIPFPCSRDDHETQRMSGRYLYILYKYLPKYADVDTHSPPRANQWLAPLLKQASSEASRAPFPRFS